MFEKFKLIVFQDVANENETKKVSVILRLNAIIMCIYFLSLIAVFLVMGMMKPFFMCIPGVCAYVLAFYVTYINKTKLAVFFSEAVMLIWIVGFVVEFGWDCGVQHFIFVFLIIGFTISYKGMAGKIGISLGACLIRLLLYAYTTIFGAYYMLDKRAVIIFQIMNTVFIFATMTAVMAVFTKDSQEMEKKLVLYNKKLRRLAAIDPLTGLLNRRSMKDFLEKRESECREGIIENLSLAIGDIDFFKKINDTYGHECGDVVLKKLASIFEDCVGGKGVISRWGGEEFLFAFSNVNGDEALIILDEMRKCLKKTEIQYKDKIVKITMTFGLSEFDFQRGIDYSINEADTKLYQGKESGRDKIVY